METEIISQREFARRIGVSEATVRKAITNDWIVGGCTTRESGRPAINFETALNEWNASPAGLQAAEKNNGKPASSYIPKKDRSAAPTTSEKITTPVAGPKAPLYDPEAAAAKKKIIENKQNSSQIEVQRRAIELQRLMGKLVDKDLVDNILFDYGKGLRDNLVTIPDRYIDDIRNAPDRNSAHEILLNGITEALRSLSTPPDLTNTRV